MSDQIDLLEDVIDWHLAWEMITLKIGVSNYRDVLNSDQVLINKKSMLYYDYAFENNLERRFDEVFSTSKENLNSKEKKFMSLLDMEKEFNTEDITIPEKKDFHKEAMLNVFNGEKKWEEKWFDLSLWSQCYWSHILILDKLTINNPTRKEKGYLLFDLTNNPLEDDEDDEDIQYEKIEDIEL